MCMRWNDLNTAHYIEAFQVGDAYLDKLEVLFMSIYQVRAT